ncbi:MAG TPA: non-homologous end-joining DNA ligase [Bryobacteraceae bacterium]|nr:non-homologous end-joining DNA ligase [Bryobacteraceae bacterium]
MSPTRPERARLTLPHEQNELELTVGRKKLRLTNLQKPFWPGITKRDLLQYYAEVSPYLLAHLKNRATVMKRYPNGASGAFFFMKRAPEPRPAWVRVCPIEHASGNVIDFPIVQDLAGLLWIVNLGCIDLNPWYARCDDVHRPDYLHFDLDPVTGATFERVLESALRVREALAERKIPCYAKTSGSRGMHIYIPIKRRPVQKQVWAFAKELAKSLEARYPDLITAEYRVARRPEGRVLVDYNQNAWGRTLASVYSVRPTPRATVSTPVTWAEVERGIRIEDFRIDNMAERLREIGDLWKAMEAARGRVDLEKLL